MTKYKTRELIAGGCIGAVLLFMVLVGIIVILGVCGVLDTEEQAPVPAPSANSNSHTGAHTDTHTGAHTETHTGAHTDTHTDGNTNGRAYAGVGIQMLRSSGLACSADRDWLDCRGIVHAAKPQACVHRRQQRRQVLALHRRSDVCAGAGWGDRCLGNDVSRGTRAHPCGRHNGSGGFLFGTSQAPGSLRTSSTTRLPP